MSTVPTFITVQYGENEKLMINPNCRQVIFMEYLRKKCQYDKKACIDLLDENGNLANLHRADPQENVRANFEDRLIYIPVMLERTIDPEIFKTVKPLLEDWEKAFPTLERRIKVLTGELKRRKSPRLNVDPRGGGGRNVDRRASSSLKADGAGRSSSYLGRPSSINSSTGGRKSSKDGGQKASKDGGPKASKEGGPKASKEGVSKTKGKQKK